MQTIKASNGEITMFESPTRGITTNNNPYKTFVDAHNPNEEFTVKLVKEGRNYYSMLHYADAKDENGNPVWVETEKVSSLRAPKQLVINASQTKESKGEALFHIHDVKIESQE